MSSDSEWHRALQAAVAALERSEAAPAWLRAAMQAAVADADALAPQALVTAAPPEHVYPH